MAVQCSNCQKSFRIQADYNRHRKQHDQPFKCTLCLTAFALKTNLNRHKLALHSEWAVKCNWPSCKFRTAREDHLRKHMRKHGLKIQMDGSPSQITGLEAKVETLYQQSVREARASAAEFRPTFHEAVANGDEKEVSRLIANGANVNAQTPSFSVSRKYRSGKKWPETPLSLSVLHRRETIFRILLNMNPSRKSLLWAFHACIKTDNLLLAGELMKKGVGVNEADPERGNRYPLEMAAAGNHKEILEFLLHRGAIIHPSFITMDRSPLINAADKGYAECVKLLLENGADINLKGGIWGSALEAASFYGKEGVVKLLLEKGANPNIRSQFDDTPLKLARRQGYPRIETLLIEHGATE